MKTCALAFGLLLMAIWAPQTGYCADETNSAAGKEQVLQSNELQMLALRKEVDEAEATYNRTAREGGDEKLWKAYVQLNQTNLPKILALARQDPKSETAFETFKWILMSRLILAPSLYTNALQSLEFLRDDDATHSGLALLCRQLGHNWRPACQPAMEFLQAVADKNPDRETRGQATLGLARLKKEDFDEFGFYKNAPPTGNTRFEKYRADFLNNTNNENPAACYAEAQACFHKVLDEYADCPSLTPTNTWQVKDTLADYAKADLFELEHLSIGDTAPDIEGKDLNGKKLRLGNYRGKVVVLSFWASWCGPCMALVPSEVRLAERMKGKPFAIVGVNGDGQREDATRAVKKNNMIWPSFWSDKGPDGPIPTAWNVHGWPTVFILDANGVIRFKDMGYGPSTEKLLDQKVDQVLAQSTNQAHR